MTNQNKIHREGFAPVPCRHGDTGPLTDGGGPTSSNHQAQAKPSFAHGKESSPEHGDPARSKSAGDNEATLVRASGMPGAVVMVRVHVVRPTKMRA